MNIPVQTLSSGSGNAFTWIILTVFFGIIIVLIIVASIGARKDKMDKMIENDKRSKDRKEADESRIIVFSSLKTIIDGLEAELKDFKPSVGTKSLGQINKEYSDKINKINKSQEIKKIYLSEDYKLEMKPILDELSKVKPSTWDKEATFATNLVAVKLDAISKNKDNKATIDQGAKKEWN